MYTRRGLGEPPTPGDTYGASWCGSGNAFIDFFCPDSAKKTVMEQIITDTSDYGGHLTPESRAAAEQMARDVIAADDPCNYSEINNMGWIDKQLCNLKGRGGSDGVGFVPVALLVGAVALFSIMRH